MAHDLYLRCVLACGFFFSTLYTPYSNLYLCLFNLEWTEYSIEWMMSWAEAF